MVNDKRIAENELVLPSLFLMKVNNGHITTKLLKEQLRNIMKPSGEDLEILNNRSDDKFSQKVRNLKSHDTFERLGYAEYKNDMFYLTNNGEKHLQENQDVLNYLLINDFSYNDIIDSLNKISSDESKKTIQIFDENIIIQEGIKEVVEKDVYTRSKKLRDYALVFYGEKYNGLYCTCCSFNFVNFYGEVIGDNFIEMHHIKPIFQYKGDDIIKTLKDAVLNITPLCSNCHRMIHRNRKQPLQIDFLTEQIKKYGHFNIREPLKTLVFHTFFRYTINYTNLV
jgi:predicted HNH restriction endonuclease